MTDYSSISLKLDNRSISLIKGYAKFDEPFIVLYIIKYMKLSKFDPINRPVSRKVEEKLKTTKSRDGGRWQEFNYKEPRSLD